MSTYQPGYILNGLPIEYINISIEDHYKHGGVFLATKIVETCVIEYSQTGRVIYSNAELMDRFQCTRRGLQLAFDQLEATDIDGKPIYGIIKRTYSDDAKRNRTGIEVDITKAIEWLSAKDKDVLHLDRGNLFKHFVMQSVIVIKKYAKKLRSAIEHVKNNKNKAKWEALIADLNNEKIEHESYIKSIVKKANKLLSRSIQRASDKELEAGLYDLVIGLGFTNPPNR
ncbi:MAG: hypothetical protein QXI16_02345 [Sulfolobaceae archaeon]